jgi:uncharacterized phage-associated protein
MRKVLDQNKEVLTKVAYKKVIGALEAIRLSEDSSKIYLVAKYIIAKMEDITPLALQKILYYIQGFSTCLLESPIFSDTPQAWVHGPVYKNIYNRFSYYSYNSIDKNEFSDYKEINISSEELNLIDEIISDFGMFSGKALEKMTHISNPWISNRKNLYETDSSNSEIKLSQIEKYFANVKKEYNIKSYKDISFYCMDMFEKINSCFLEKK